MIVAAQLYTVRNELVDRRSLAAVLRRLGDIGYEAVEVAGLPPALAESLPDELAAATLSACAAHVSLERLQRDPDAAAVECASWGCGYVVVPSLPTEYHSRDGFVRFAAEAQGIAEKVEPFRLELAYHNHSFELERADGATWLETLFQHAPPESLKAELDTYWLQHGGASPPAWIRSLSGRVPLVHLKDMSVIDNRPVQAEVGEGNMDWLEIFGACRESGTRWLIVEQDDVRDPMASLELSYRNISRLLGAA